MEYNMLAHLDHSGRRAHQHIPFPLDIIGARYEFLLMKVLGWLTDQDWLYGHKVTRAALDWTAYRLVLPAIHGEVLTPAEIENLVRNLEDEGMLMAVGICECRHGENNIDGELVEGVDPNYTCVMIGDWGKGHLYNYPSMYRRVGADELIEKARFWHERGRVLNAWGMFDSHGFVVSYCHCLPDYCVPLRNQLRRGTSVFLPGTSYAVHDADRCLGPGECPVDCTTRCYFGAIEVRDGKAVSDPSKCLGCGQCFVYCPNGAASPRRKEGFELVFCPPDLISRPRNNT